MLKASAETSEDVDFFFSLLDSGDAAEFSPFLGAMDLDSSKVAELSPFLGAMGFDSTKAAEFSPFLNDSLVERARAVPAC